MKVINLYGGPGTGKSTTAAGLYHKLKINHISAEIVTEFAKDLVYEERLKHMLDQQEYIFAEQNRRLHRLRDKVDYAIIDSPLLLSNVYVNDDWCCASAFKQLVTCTYDSYDNINFVLSRPDEFQEYGRDHTKEESEAIDNKVEEVLIDGGYKFMNIKTDDDTVDNIIKNILLKKITG